MTALSALMLVLPASAHAVLREWERQTWFAEVHHWLEHHPFCVGTSVSQHPKTPAHLGTVIGRAYTPAMSASGKQNASEVMNVHTCLA